MKLIRARDLFISNLLLCMRDGREFENSTRRRKRKKVFFLGARRIANKFFSHFQKLHVVLIVFVCQLRLSVSQALCVWKFNYFNGQGSFFLATFVCQIPACCLGDTEGGDTIVGLFLLR